MLKHIDIENFKCFAIQRINLGRITVMAGANSAGKSSVIQSLLLSRIAFEQLRAVSFEMTTPIAIPLNGSYHLSLGNTLEVLNRDANRNIIRFAFQSADSKHKEEFVFKVEDVEASVYDLLLASVVPSNSNYGFEASLFQEQFHYLNAERIGPRLTSAVEAMPYLNVGSQGEYTIQVLNNTIHDVAINRLADSNLTANLFRQSVAWMDKIVPGVLIDDVSLIGKLKTASVTFSRSSPPNVGFGVSYVLPIVVGGLVAAEGSMLVVENPEAHLHPSGQSRIGQFLARIASTGVQVVVETHSEHVINGIRVATLDGTLSPDDALVNFFSRFDDGKPKVTPIHFTSKGDLEQWPRDFFDQQQQDFAQIIRLKNQR